MASIEKRSANSYRITVSTGYDVEGKKIRKHKTITLDAKLTPKQIEKELQRQATLFQEEVDRGLYLDGGKMTFAEFVAKWRDDYAAKQLQPKTLYRYEGLLRRIIPAIGHIRMEKLQPTHLLEFYNNLQEKGIREDMPQIAKGKLKEILEEKKMSVDDLATASGMNMRTIKSILAGNPTKSASVICKTLLTKQELLFSPKDEAGTLCDRTILHHHRLISSILSCAVQWQVIVSNPAERVKPPKVESKEVAHYDETASERLLELLDNEPLKYKAMMYITLFAGCRLGELSALEWSDVDFESNLLRIRQASQYIPGKGTFTKAPKNESSCRNISMPPMVMDVLKKYKVWQNEERLKLDEQWQDHDRLFTQWDGKPIYPSTPSQWFRKFKAKHNLPDIRFHGLRHTNASLLIGEGIDVQTVAKRLGHARATTTTTIYSHFLRKPDQEAAAKLENKFNRNKTEAKKQA